MGHPIDRILELQQLDAELDRLLERKRAIEAEEPLRELADQLRRLEERLHALHKARQEHQRRAQREEAEAEELRREKERLEARLYGGEISSMKEMEKMEARIAQLGEQVDARETEALEAMEAVQKLEPQIKTLEAQKNQSEQEWVRARARFATELKEIEQKLDVLRPRRQGLEESLPEDILEPYRFHRQRRGGVVLVPSRGGVCTGCGVDLPIALRTKVAKRESLETCEHCGRLLVAVEE